MTGQPDEIQPQEIGRKGSYCVFCGQWVNAGDPGIEPGDEPGTYYWHVACEEADRAAMEAFGRLVSEAQRLISVGTREEREAFFRALTPERHKAVLIALNSRADREPSDGN